MGAAAVEAAFKAITDKPASTQTIAVAITIVTKDKVSPTGPCSSNAGNKRGG